MKQNVVYYLALTLVTLVLVVTRFIASGYYDPLEDELLALDNSFKYSVIEQFQAKDFTHPWLWYVLMEVPTNVLGTDHGIVPYRTIHIAITVFFVLTIGWLLRQKKEYFYLLATLFLTNVSIIHLTFQHRMYALVLGLGFLYSVLWKKHLDEDKQLSKRQIGLLAFVAAAGFFTNYSFVWLLPVWPLVYLASSYSLNKLKNVAKFFVFLAVITVWFLPTFLMNVRLSVDANQWAPPLNLATVVELIPNYFGLYVKNSAVNWVLFSVLFSLIGVFLDKKIDSQTKKKTGISILALLLLFSLYLLATFITGDSLLYVRVALPLIFVVYGIFPELFSKSIYAKVLFILLVAIQLLGMYRYYYSPERDINLYINYQTNPLRILGSRSLDKNDCVIASPYWNRFSVSYFFPEPAVIELYKKSPEGVKDLLKKCDSVFFVFQTSVDMKYKDVDLGLLQESGYSYKETDNYENQQLYEVSL